jgi:hypothetical protein
MGDVFVTMLAYRKFFPNCAWRAILDRPMAGFRPGDRVWLKGELRSMKCPGERYAMTFVAPTHFEVVKRRTSAA